MNKKSLWRNTWTSFQSSSFLVFFPSGILIFSKVTKQDSKQICTKPGSSHPFAEHIEGKDQRWDWRQWEVNRWSGASEHHVHSYIICMRNHIFGCVNSHLLLLYSPLICEFICLGEAVVQQSWRIKLSRYVPKKCGMSTWIVWNFPT